MLFFFDFSWSKFSTRFKSRKQFLKLIFTGQRQFTRRKKNLKNLSDLNELQRKSNLSAVIFNINETVSTFLWIGNQMTKLNRRRVHFSNCEIILGAFNTRQAQHPLKMCKTLRRIIRKIYFKVKRKQFLTSRTLQAFRSFPNRVSWNSIPDWILNHLTHIIENRRCSKDPLKYCFNWA